MYLALINIMQHLTSVYVISAATFVVALYLIRKISKARSLYFKSANYQPKGNVQAQDEYLATKSKVERSYSELIELSWKFLYIITDIVTQRFSKNDQVEVLACGKTLTANGCSYQHVVEYSIAVRTQSVGAVRAVNNKNVKSVIV